jgi:hypothetical protein
VAGGVYPGGCFSRMGDMLGYDAADSDGEGTLCHR